MGVLLVTIVTIGFGAKGARARWAAMKADAEARLFPACVAGGAMVVQYGGWDGSVHRFWFRSHEYASEFIRVNRSKILNVQPWILREVDAGRMLQTPDSQLALMRSAPPFPRSAVIWGWVALLLIGARGASALVGSAAQGSGQLSAARNDDSVLQTATALTSRYGPVQAEADPRNPSTLLVTARPGWASWTQEQSDKEREWMLQVWAAQKRRVGDRGAAYSVQIVRR